MNETNRFLQRIAQGDVLCAEGYLFELERRGYLQAGAFVPEVVSEHPEVVRQLHMEFARAGSDVVEALTYYAHREKMRLVGREEELEPMNRQAIRLAKEVAAETGTLAAGNICNTNIYDPNDPESIAKVKAIYAEQMEWIADEGVDFVIAETIPWQGEAELALDAVVKTGLPAVVTLAIHKDGLTREGFSPADTCKALEDRGAAVVGLNCARGPDPSATGRWVRPDGSGKAPAARRSGSCTLPRDPQGSAAWCPAHGHPDDGRPFPVNLDSHTCTRTDIARFTAAAKEIGVRYFGICCGAGPHHIRAMAEALGRHPEASKYSADMSKHYALGEFDAQLEQDRSFTGNL